MADYNNPLFMYMKIVKKLNWVDIDILDAIHYFAGDIPIKWLAWAIPDEWQDEWKKLHVWLTFEEDGTVIKRVTIKYDLIHDGEERVMTHKLIYTDESEFGKFLTRTVEKHTQKLEKERIEKVIRKIAISKIKRNALYNNGLGLKLAVRAYSKDF
jgi:hypothetical protein